MIMSSILSKRCRFMLALGLLALLSILSAAAAAVAPDAQLPISSSATAVSSALSIHDIPPIPDDCTPQKQQQSPTRGRYKALVCWLWNLKISLPNMQFTEGLFTINVHDMVCTNFRVASMKSSSSSSTSSSSSSSQSSGWESTTSSNPFITVDLFGMSASCSGKYDLPEFGIYGDDLVASVSSSSGVSSSTTTTTTTTTTNVINTSNEPTSATTTLHLQVDIASRPLQDGKNDIISLLPFPTLATFSSCTPNFIVNNVQFSGSLAATIIGLFSGVISHQVTLAINEHVCAVVKMNGESLLDHWLLMARQYVVGLLLNSTDNSAAAAAAATTASAEWRDGIISSRGDSNIDDVSLNHIHSPVPEQQASQQLSRSLLKTKTNSAVSWDKDMPFLKRVLLKFNTFLSEHLNEGIILKLLQRLSTWQTTMSTTDCEDCGFLFKGVNGFVDSITKGAGSLEISIPDKFLNFQNNHTFTIPNYGDVTLTVHKVKVSGINKLTDLSLFRPSGQNMVSSSIASDAGFNISVLIDLEVRPSNGTSVVDADMLNETFELHFNTSNVNLDSFSSWVIDHDIFSKLTVGSFMFGSYTVFDNNRNFFNCIIEALTSVTFLELQGRMKVDALQISPITSSANGSAAGLEGDIDELINHVMHLVLSEYPLTLTETLSGMIQIPTKNLLNHKLATLIGETKMMPLHCVNVDIPTNKSEHPLRLDSNRALMIFDEIVNADSAIAYVNSFIGCVDNTVETMKLVNGHFFNFTLGDLEVVLHDLRTGHTASVYDMKLLQPEIDHYHLTNRLGYGMCPSSDQSNDCNQTSFSFGMNLAHSKQGELGNINIHINMTNLQVQGGTELRYDINYLPFLSISDLMAFPQCMTIPITKFQFLGLNATIQSLDVNIEVSLVGSENRPRSLSYRTEDALELANVVSALLSEGAILLEKELGEHFLIQLDEASKVCNTPANPRRSIYSAHSIGAAGLWTFLIIVALIAGNTWLFLRGVEQDKQYGNIGSNDAAEVHTDERECLNEPLLDTDGLDERLEVETTIRKLPFTSSTSLMYHSSIHPYLKYGFPAILIVTFVLFLSSNLSIGASVDLLLTRANGSNFASPFNIYSFSLGSTLKEMIQAGVYLLLLLILFCSGVWPYVKLVLMMMSWAVSTRRLPPVRREKVLYMLDSLGKFSLIDAYVLVLMMVAFRYSLDVEGVGSLNVFVTPKFGFYSFLFATILSLIGGHAMLYLHRRTTIPFIPIYSGRKESLAKHVFDDKRGRGLVKFTKRFRRSIVFMLLITLGLISCGVCLKCFHFKFNGAAGMALGNGRFKSFSLVSIGEHIPRSVQDSSSFGVRWIQTCYFFFALIMPIMCIVCMLALFIVPMKLKVQQKVFVLAEVANAWSAIEVFVIAIVASLVEIAPFSESMVGKNCSILNQILSGWSISGDSDDDMHYCFDVKSSIDGSSSVLIIGVILNSLLVSSVHRFAHHAIWERIEREDRPDATEQENKTVRECVLAHTFVSRLRKRPRLGAFMFEEVSFGPNSEYDIDFRNVTEHDDPTTSSNTYWAEWRKVVSVI